MYSRELTQRKISLSIEMEYYPRSRPANPIASHSEFLESVKLTPGRWFQSQSEVNVGGGTIGCDVRNLPIVNNGHRHSLSHILVLPPRA